MARAQANPALRIGLRDGIPPWLFLFSVSLMAVHSFPPSSGTAQLLPLPFPRNAVEKSRRRFLEDLRLDRQDILAGRFGKKVDLERMDLIGPVHLRGNTVQNPFNVIDVVDVIVNIDIAVTDLV